MKTDTVPSGNDGANALPAFDSQTRRQFASLDDVYLDGTLVLIGCGSAKRHPDDRADLATAAVQPGETCYLNGVETSGPAWQARDLYTSPYYRVKREFAELVSQWARDHPNEASPWAILSAEHGILPPWKVVARYETELDDIGGDETDPDHWVRNTYARRRPDGREIVTERDR